MTNATEPAADAPGTIGRKLWAHGAPETTEMHRFKEHIAAKYAQTFGPETDAETSLWAWSVANIPEFWAEVWAWTGVVAARGFDSVVDADQPMFPRQPWFAGAKLNFAENLLWPACGADAGAVAVIAATEAGREHITWAQLRERTRAWAAALAGKVAVGDRVVGKCAPAPPSRRGGALTAQGSWATTRTRWSPCWRPRRWAESGRA